MPLEHRYIERFGGDRSPEIDGVLHPGEGIRAFFDISTGMARMILMRCNDHDNGGAIFVEDEPSIVRRMLELEGDDEVSIDTSKLHQVILPGLAYEQVVKDIEGNESILVVQHRMPDGSFQTWN